MGLISPITLKYKIELSENVKMKDLSWDDGLGKELTDHWVELITEIVNLPELKFYRSAKPEGAQGAPEMIVFWDDANPVYSGNIFLIWQVPICQNDIQRGGRKFYSGLVFHK
jgi:hypothetical protein